MDEPSTSLVDLRIRDMAESRTRWWFLHPTECGERIDGRSRSYSNVGRITVHHSHKNGPRTKWLLYLEGGCEKKGTSFDVVGSGDCREVGDMCPWTSRLNGFVARRFPGWEIKEVGGCSGLVFVEGVKSMENKGGSIAVAKVYGPG
jgi:hypothetical protein